MAQVTGVGGIFLKCPDPEATKAWYARVLGMQPSDHGGFDFIHKDSAAMHPMGARTVYGIFDAATDYFDPSSESFMINLMVDDLDAMLHRLAGEGVAELQPRQDYEYGRFAWIMDPDGRKLELWQPPS